MELGIYTDTFITRFRLNHNQKLVKTKKALPIMLSFLAIVSIASTAVLGNTQTAYAGVVAGCVVDPDFVDRTIATDESIKIPKRILCFLVEVKDVDINIDDCEAKRIFVSFANEVINLGAWTGDETIAAPFLAKGEMANCQVIFDVDFFVESDKLIQEIKITGAGGFEVGGEFLPIDSTALLLSSAQSFSWMIPVVLSVIGIGLFVVSRKSE